MSWLLFFHHREHGDNTENHRGTCIPFSVYLSQLSGYPLFFHSNSELILLIPLCSLCLSLLPLWLKNKPISIYPKTNDKYEQPKQGVPTPLWFSVPPLCFLWLERDFIIRKARVNMEQSVDNFTVPQFMQ